MEERNQRPQEGSKLPVIALGVLVFIIIALLYVGYEYAADGSSSTTDITNGKLDTTVTARPDDEEVQPVEAKPEKRPQPVPRAEVKPADDEVQNSEASVVEEPEKPKPAAKPKPVAEKKPEPEKPEASAPMPTGGTTVSHTVATGQTFYGIANRYNMKWETLKKLNPTIEDKNIKVGVTKLNIRVKAVHTVGPGDILRVVAAKYGVTVEQLMVANGKTKNAAQRGEKLIVPFPVKE